LKPSRQCQEARKKSLKMLGMLNRNVEYKSKIVMKKLYCAYVRPHLEYCVQAWHPMFKKDAVSMEKVQRKATKLIRGLKKLKYEERLKILNLHSLQYRRLRGGLIELFKILKGNSVPELQCMFHVNKNTTRGHDFKLKKGFVKTLLRQNFFSQRVVNCWNSLPKDAIDSSSVQVFRNKLDKYYSERGVVYEYETD